MALKIFNLKIIAKILCFRKMRTCHSSTTYRTIISNFLFISISDGCSYQKNSSEDEKWLVQQRSSFLISLIFVWCTICNLLPLEKITQTFISFHSVKIVVVSVLRKMTVWYHPASQWLIHLWFGMRGLLLDKYSVGSDKASSYSVCHSITLGWLFSAGCGYILSGLWKMFGMNVKACF